MIDSSFEYMYQIETGYWEASFVIQDNRCLLLCEENEALYLFLYDRQGTWLNISELIGEEKEFSPEFLPDLQNRTWFFYAGALENKIWRVKMLRNPEVAVPDIARRLFFDRRCLFGKPLYIADRILQFHYGTYGDLAICEVWNPAHLFHEQIRNEWYQSVPFAPEESLCEIQVKCHLIQGNYIGLCFEEKEPEEMIRACVPIADMRASGHDRLLLSFLVPKESVKDQAFLLWREWDEVYHTPLYTRETLLAQPETRSLEEYLHRRKNEPREQLEGMFVPGQDGTLRIQFACPGPDIEEAQLVYFHTQGMGTLAAESLVLPGDAFHELPMIAPEIDNEELFPKPIGSIWMRIALAVRGKQEISFFYLSNEAITDLGYRDGNLYDERCLYQKPIGEGRICNVCMSAVPYYGKNKRLSLKYVRPEQLYRSQFCNELVNVTIHKDVLKVLIRCRACEGVYQGVLMEYRHVREDEAESFLVPYDSLRQLSDGRFLMTVHIPLKEHYMRMLYWDIRSAFKQNGVLYHVANYSNRKRFLAKYDGIFVDRFYPGNSSILFPYATDNHSVALMHRETCPQDHWRFRAKEKLAVLAYQFSKHYWNRKKIYLVFEKYCTMAQDNGFYFFRYCMESHVEEAFQGHVYYVIDPASADMEVLRPYQDHVVKYLSFRHMLLLQACNALISTDTKGHAYVWRSMGSRLKKLSYEKPLVFLQHGVTAFKRGHFERGTKVGCESFITTSRFEQDIICNYLGYPRKEVPITGFSRWDVLRDRSGESREILMMPTWRTWLDDAEHEVFAQSDYCRNYMALLNDPRLDQALKEQGITLNFYLHPKFRKYITEFSVVSDHIHLIPFGEQPLNDLMMTCRLLITDFSSVAWDVYYMKKPVLFYHFDMEESSKTLGFYMDMKNDLFGDRAETPEELVQLILEYVARDFRIKEQYLEQFDQYFAYVDDQNSKRIWEAIQNQF